MGMVQKQGNWVPYELKPGNIERRICTCELLLKRQNRKGFLHRIVTRDEKWIHYDNPKRRKSWVMPGHASTSTAKPNIHGKKLMLCIWWDQLGVIYYELLQPNETITGERYQQQLMRLSRALKIKRPLYAKRHDKVIYQHGNARPHVAKVVKETLEALQWDVLPHPLYSPDIAPSNYHINQKPKTPYSIISPTSMTQKNQEDAQPVHNPDAHLWAATQDTTEENNVEVQAPASPQSFYWTPPASHQYQVNPETAPSPHISTWGNPFSPQYRENAQGYDQIETQTSANPQTSYWPTSAAEPFQMKPNSAANPYVSNWTTPMPQQYQANTQSVNNPNVQFWNNPNSQEYHIKAQNSADPHTSHWTPPATEALQMTTPTTANITEMKNPKNQQYQMRSQSSVNPQVSSWTDSGTELVQIRTKKEANLHITTRTFPQQYQGEVQPLTNTMLPTWTKSTTKSYQVRTQTAAYPNVTSRTRPDRVKPGPQSSDTSSHTHKNKMAYRLCELAVSDPIVQIMVNETTEEFLSSTPPIPVEDIEYNREIIEETHDVSEEELEQDDEEALQYTQRYKRIYKKCLALVEPRINASSPTTSEVSFASSSHHRTVKLPKIELKKFTREIKDWLGWWAQFNKIHVDPTLEDSDKFQYIVQSMSPGTRASKLVDSYPLTAENYPKVIETLTERFGRPELLQQVYVRDLIRLMIDCSSKQQLKVTSFYDELVTHLRALESLKIEARQMSVFIFPMIEACLSEELMKAWQRSPLHGVKIDANDSTQTRVDLIMEFLQKEAAAEQDRALAGSKFGLRSLKQDRNVGRQSHPAKIPTASGLFAGRAQNCIFCNKDHKNTECLAARRMSIKERRERIKNAKCCISCLQPGHISSNCRRRITGCIRCKKKHLDILCPLNATGRESADEDKEQVEDCDVSSTVENGVSFSGLSASSLILLQTLKIKVEGMTSAKVVRALLDTGSQRSYILSKTAQDLILSPIGQESLKHVVFGGHTSESVHQEYRVNLGHASGNFKMVAKLLDQQKICGNLPRLSRGPWLEELKARRIWVPDIGKDDMEIEILLGCDVLGSIFMMKSCMLSNGLTASQTRFGWTLMGECQPGSDVSLAHHVTTMTISESSITNLWNLDVLGIMDPIEVKQRDQRDALARRHFLKTVQHSVSGRYVVSLPWTLEKAKIADNREVAMKRLEQTTKKLISLNLYEDYDDIFRGWLDDGIIEKVPAEQHDAEAFYLPHRPVVKLSSGTTPIRPVFDASSKVYRSPSLNDCLEKGPNLIEMIPNLMLRFRNGKFGVVADIKKAFLQIEMNERDRDYLRFLWYSQNGEKTEVFRHRRVVFGVNCSPFILWAVIEYHLSNVRYEHKPLAQRLQKSFYVDNLVKSVNSFEELKDLKLTATSIMDNARMELSRWEHSLDVASGTYPFERAEISKVLGICWDKREDCLSCEISAAIPPKITKRSILSCLAQIYDPIGFLNSILIKPKILLQKAWTLKLAWDDELDRHYKDELSLWFDDLQLHKAWQFLGISIH
ncbi:hypothetical protein LAZ67_2000915 [Cordylochernes scorpioides]|uniref:Reverse transcriptase domain-containing protein n=1 Tax=Cordylochernes scorpioides TaxID=51811 RepID=A0ABY6K236_9ARAC|nr:hypothetical protein LAZ67_2000915 [Cordylochernes scorpioides]